MNAPVIDPEQFDERKYAKILYWQGFRIARISEMLEIKDATIHSWKKRDQWDKTKPLDRVTGVLEARLIQLIMKDPKEGKDFKEIDNLMRQMERSARIGRYLEPGGHEGHLNPKVENRNKGPKKKPVKNEFSPEQADKLREAFMDSLFEYQRVWHQAGLVHRIRDINKSRQIGATYYFGREAGMDAVDTGRNQIFLSASKAQAHVFKHYITQFFWDAAEIELTGDPIVLPNAATMYFLGTNSRTAQGYHGNLYFDEYFWTHRFKELRKVASGMAMHKKWRQTYFSTPSSITHEAYEFWNGDLFNKGRAKKDRVEIDISHSALKDGMLCADGKWRQIVTIEDAIAGGCDLFDLDQLRLEYSHDEYMNLLMCEFVDDSTSMFPLPMLQKAMVDSWEVWGDFYKPFAMRPVGNRGVWVGYDPNGESETGDKAGLVVVLPAEKPGDKHRILEKHQLRGLDYEAQAEKIHQICKRYNVVHIGIDVTGIGSSVFQLVRKFFPAAQEYKYTPEVKTQLVIKTLNLLNKGRIEFDAGWSDFAQSFMAIKKTMTPSGMKMTFGAGRNSTTGHADLAWATMHALDKEPLDGATQTSTGITEIY
jgi:uncharacterized protein YjcR